MTGWEPGLPLADHLGCWASFTRSSPFCLYFEEMTGLCLRLAAMKKSCPSQGKEVKAAPVQTYQGPPPEDCHD